MRISWKWLSELVDLSDLKSPEALAELLTRRGLEVEGIERQSSGFDHVVTAQILEKKPHPQADRLSLCQVTVGVGESFQIVCGAQNMKAGDKVALAQVGAHLPNGVKISQSKIRGETSNGMLCSEEELKLKDESEGIMILSESTPLGKPLAEILNRDDTVLTLKITPNRADCLSHLGIAREVAAALAQEVNLSVPQFESIGRSPISIELNADDGARQFIGCYIQGVKIGPSPEWLVKRLETLGSRSINNVVDATNWVMLELGHPTHAYDADQIHGQKIQVRTALAGEKLPLLDGQTIDLDGFELVIADAQRAIGLAGVMGGGNSEVQASTQNIYLECAEFKPTLVRRASTRHQRKTDAAHRFERGVDPAALPRVMARLISLVLELAGGQVVGSQAVQLQSQELELKGPKPISIEPHYIGEFLGFSRQDSSLTLDRVEQILVGLDCQVSKSAQQWLVTPPSYRLDLRIKQDLAEEVARSLGYDAIPSTIPPLSSSPLASVSARSRLTLMERTKQVLVREGFLETINFAFTSRDWLAKFGLESSVKLINPLSEEFEYMVPSLLPGLVRNALGNWNHHFGSEPLAIRLFELRPTFKAQSKIAAQGEMQTGVEESWKLAFMFSGPQYAESLRSERGEVDFKDVKAVIEALLFDLGAKGVRFQPMNASRTGGNPLFHPGQSVEILAGNGVAGHFGLLHPAKAREFKTRAPLWMAEIDWDQLIKLSRPAFDVPKYKPWPEYPAIERDFALLVKKDVSVDKICQVALKAGKPLARSAQVFDIYEGSQVAQGMTSVAVRVIFYEESRSLQESEAEAASARILEAWKQEFGAELRT